VSDISGITYQAALPLRWQRQAAPSDEALAVARHANMTLLQALSTLESASDKDHDADQPAAKSIERLEAKLDIALSLLSKLVAQHTETMPVRPVTMGVHHIEWREETADLDPGTTVLIDLHLNPKLPDPLRLYARIVSVRSGACTAEFLDEDEELEEWITRTLFRYHRRMLQARHHV
jgi:hypothetical protein